LIEIARFSSDVTVDRFSSDVTVARFSSDVTVAIFSSNVTVARFSSNVTVARFSSDVKVARFNSNVTVARFSSDVTVDRFSSDITFTKFSSGVTVAKFSSDVTVAMKLLKTVLSGPRWFRLNSNVTVRGVLWTAMVLATLTCLLMFASFALSVYWSNYEVSTIHRPILVVSQLVKHNDTLRELNSAGFMCQQKSIKMTIIADGIMNSSQSNESPTQRLNTKNQASFLVQNVVHYVWLGSDLEFKFIHYLSFLSVHRFIVPSYIFVHGEHEPTGYWWNRTIYDVDNIIHVEHAQKNNAPNGKPFRFKAHASDVMRTEILYSKYETVTLQITNRQKFVDI